MNRAAFLKLVIVIGIVIWLFAVTISYYIVHKPFTFENLMATVNALADVGAMLALYVLASAIGRRVLRAIQFATPLEEIVFHTGFGLGIVSFATFVIGLVWANTLLFWWVYLGALALMRDDVRATWRVVRAIVLPRDSRWERWLAIFCGCVLVIGFFFTVTPPIAWDAQTYHLMIPQRAITVGRIVSPPDILYFSFPSLVEMLFLAAIALKSDIAAQLTHFGFLLLTLGALFALAHRYFNSWVAWLACAMVLAVPSLLLVSTWAYVDLALTFYALASLYALLVAREADNARWISLSGAFAGFALGVKYTAAIIPVALIVILVIGNWKLVIGNWRFVIRHLSFVIVFAAPWYLRNLVFTGNPVYPFVFGGPYWDAFRSEWFSRFGTGYWDTPLKLLLAPWDATIYGIEGALGYEATIGPLLLMLLPLLFLPILNSRTKDLNSEFRIPNSMLDSLLIFSVILYLFWLTGIAESHLLWQTRLLFPAFPVLALLAAHALDRLRGFDLPQFSAHNFARLVIAAVLGLTLAGYALTFAQDNPLRYLAGFETRDAYLARHLGGYYSAAQFINTQLPANARVLYLWEPRGYFVRRDVSPDSILDKVAHLDWKYGDAARVAGALRAEGYTHILLNRAGFDFHLQSDDDPITRKEINLILELTTQYLKPVYGAIPLQIETRDGKRSVVGASDEPYAVYEWTAR